MNDIRLQHAKTHFPLSVMTFWLRISIDFEGRKKESEKKRKNEAKMVKSCHALYAGLIDSVDYHVLV